MKEKDFVRQNKDKWLDFENTLNDKQSNPDKLRKVFIHITDDLSYSRTFFPKRSIRLYLNQLSQKVFHGLYKNKKENKFRLISFWKEELPQVLWESRFEMLTSFIIFALSVIVGIVSTHIDSDFTRTILGDGYVDMTLENIEKGEPMAVYKSGGSMSSFLSITINNITVAFKTFISGIFVIFGAVVILVYNGIMVGSFQYFFFQHNEAISSLSTIWLHGTLEISSIIIAGAAGLTLGKGLLFPGTYSRGRALQMSAKRGIKIMIGLVPIFIIAGFIEGFITRNTEASIFLKGLLIFVSLAFVIIYFVIYPFILSRKVEPKIEKVKRIIPSKETISFYNIKNLGNIIVDTFSIYKKHFNKIFISTIIITIPFILIQVLVLPLPENYVDISEALYDNQLSSMFLSYLDNGILFPIYNLMWTLIILVVFYIIVKDFKKEDVVLKSKTFLQFITNNLILTFFIVFIFRGLLVLPILLDIDEGFVFLMYLFIVFVISPLILWPFVNVFEGGNIGLKFNRSFKLAGKDWWPMIGTFLVVTILCSVYIFLLFTPLTWLYSDVFEWHLTAGDASAKVLQIILFSINSLYVNLVAIILFIAIPLRYFVIVEKTESVSLFEKLKTFGGKS